MPQNGEINPTCSVYKTVCCGHEVVVREGATFPDCPSHPRLTTIWKLVPTEIIELRSAKQSQPEPAA